MAALAAQTSAGDRVDAAYREAGRPDIVAYGDEAALRDAADDPAVAEASDPWPIVDGLSTRVDDQDVEVDVTGLDPDALPTVARPDLVEGRWTEAEDEVVVEQSLVATGIAEVGDTITVTTDAGPVDLRVVGAVVDLTDCFWPTCDPLRLFVRPDHLAGFAGDGAPSHFAAAFHLVDPDEAGAVAGRFLAETGGGIGGANSWPDTRDDILVIGTVFSALVGGFGVFLLVAAAFVVAGATAARLVARRRTLGLLAATGFTPRQLLLSVWLEHFVLGAVGVLLGWVIGTPLSPVFEAGLQDVLPGDGAAWSLRVLLVAFALVIGLLTVSVLVPAWRATRQPPTTVLRDAPSAPAGGRLIGNLARRAGASPSTVFGLRRAFARPGRAALAGGALVVATAGAVVSLGFIGTLDDVQADPAVTGNPWDVAVDAPADDAGAVEAVLDATPGVEAWFTEREQTGTVDGEGFTVRLVGGEADAAHYVVQEGRPISADDEAIVGYGFLDATGLDVGDPLTVELDGTSVDVTIVGWYSDTVDTGKIIQVREGAVPPSVLADDPTWRVVAADGVSDEALADTLNAELGDDALAEPLTVEDLGPARGAMVAMAVLLALVALVNLVATTLSGTRERARAIGVLRTVGCSTRQLVGQSAIGAGAIGLIAGLVGVPLGNWAYVALGDGLTTGIGIGPGFASEPSALLLAVVVPAGVLLAAGAGALATVGLARRPASTLVRYE